MMYTEKGLAITNFSLAVNRYDSKTRGEVAQWIRVVCFDKLAERCNQYLKKGSKVEVVGSLVIRDYVDKEGNKRQSVECSAREVNFVGAVTSRETEGQEPPPPEEDFNHPF